MREQRGFVAWPPSGYVPPEAVWGRWSFSLAGANFSRATVVMSDDDGPVQAEVIHRSPAPSPNSQSAPETAIVWVVAGDTDSDRMAAPDGFDHCYTVTISGVTVRGAAQDPYEYSTCVLGQPQSPPGGGGEHACGVRTDQTITCWRHMLEGLRPGRRAVCRHEVDRRADLRLLSV